MSTIRFFTLLSLLATMGACNLALNADTADQARMDARQMLAAHNQVRKKYKLPPLTWSSQLAAFSGEWANYLKQHTACRMQHRPGSGSHKTEYGENLFWASPLRWTDGRVEVQQITAAFVANEWAAEAKFYDYQSNRCQPGQQCGHFTQMIWKDTQQVGCAMAICADKSQVWVCSYNPPGNWQGQRPY